MKKYLSFFLMVALLLSLMSFPVLAADIQEHWGEKATERWVKAGVIDSDLTNAELEEPVSRADFAVMIVNLLGLKASSATPEFPDLPDDTVKAKALQAVAEAGIMLGNEKGESMPGKIISRAESLVLFARAFGVAPAARATVPFGDDIADWAEPYANALKNRGIIHGIGDNTFNGDSEINLASMSTIFDNAVAVYANEPGQLITGTIEGFIVVAAPNVTIRDATATEPVIVSNAADGQSVRLENVSAPGVIVDADRASVNLVNSSISEIGISGSGGSLAASGSTKINAMEISGVNATVNAAQGTSIGSIAVTGDNASIAGAGDVGEVDVISGSGTSVSTPGTSVSAGEDAEDVTAGGKPVEPGGEPVEIDPRTGGGGGPVGPPGSTISEVKPITETEFGDSEGLINWPLATWGDIKNDYAASMQLTYTVSGTTVKADGALTRITGWTEFNTADTDEQEGYYAALRFELPDDAILADSTVISLGTLSLKGTDITDERGGKPSMELAVYLGNDIDTARGRRLSITVDWDGSGGAFGATTYSFDFSAISSVEELNAPDATKTEFKTALGLKYVKDLAKSGTGEDSFSIHKAEAGELIDAFVDNASALESKFGFVYEISDPELQTFDYYTCGGNGTKLYLDLGSGNTTIAAGKSLYLFYNGSCEAELFDTNGALKSEALKTLSDGKVSTFAAAYGTKYTADENGIFTIPLSGFAAGDDSISKIGDADQNTRMQLIAMAIVDDLTGQVENYGLMRVFRTLPLVVEVEVPKDAADAMYKLGSAAATKLLYDESGGCYYLKSVHNNGDALKLYVEGIDTSSYDITVKHNGVNVSYTTLDGDTATLELIGIPGENPTFIAPENAGFYEVTITAKAPV